MLGSMNLSIDFTPRELMFENMGGCWNTLRQDRSLSRYASCNMGSMVGNATAH